MKMYVLSLLMICVISGCSQYDNGVNNDRFNLDFENIENETPVGWGNNGHYADGYLFSSDSSHAVSGKHSVSLEYHAGEATFATWSLAIPDSYKGRQIALSGYIKTENVQSGYAGLWLRLDPNVAFTNMGADGVTGTTDWTEYTITLDFNPNAIESIVVGGILEGTGKAWFDNFSIKIDGEDICRLDPIAPFPAKADREFDNGSGIPNIILDSCNAETIRQLGLVWGFLKYYHPAVTKGIHNFDFELFRVLPAMLDAKTKQAKSDTIIRWINGLGDVGPAGDEYKISDRTLLTPDLEWINTQNFTPELVDLLLKVKSAKRELEGYYASLRPLGNMSFDHEERYENMTYPDTGYRILALYRYWNIVQYFFPYKNLIGDDWNQVLGEFIPRFINAKDEAEYTAAFQGLIPRINDSHAMLARRSVIYYHFWGARLALPEITFVGSKAVVTGFMNDSLRYQTKLERGDVILSIDARPVQDIIEERAAYTPASNYPTLLREIAQVLLESDGEYIDVEYLRDGNRAESRLATYSVDSAMKLFSFDHNEPKTCYREIAPNISYLYPGKYKNSYEDELWKKIKPTNGLIVDLRCYPGDFMVHKFGALLVPRAIPFFRVAKADIRHPGLFNFGPPATIGGLNFFYYKGKVVILVNEKTQSQAEFTAMAFRKAPNSMVIGSTTAGTDGDVSEINLPGGLRTRISGMGLSYADGRQTQRIGIVPDIELHPTVEGIKAGRDELVEKAIEIINAD